METRKSTRRHGSESCLACQRALVSSPRNVLAIEARRECSRHCRQRSHQALCRPYRDGVGARADLLLRRGRGVRSRGWPVRLRQVHAAQDPRRHPARHRGRGAAARHRHRRPAQGHRRGLPVSRALPLAKRARQRAAAHRRPGPRARGASARRPGSPLPRGAAGIRGALSVGAFRRYAATGGHHPRPRARSRPPPHGRALRRPRRHDARADERGAPAHLDGEEENGALHHPLHSRGGVPGRSRARDDPAPRPDPGRRAGEERAPAEPRHHEHAGVRRARAAHPRPLQREGRDGRMNRARNIGISVVLFILLVSVWEAVVRVFQIPQFILPAPTRVTEALWRGLTSGVYVENLYYTLVSTVLGFLLGSALGFGLGTAVALSRRFEFFLYPFIVIWFGLGLTSKVVNAALVAFFPLLVNTIVGLKSADEERVSLMRSLAASEKQIFWMLRLPNSLPFVMAGLDVAMIFALIGAIVGEFVGAKHGLGMLIQSMNFTMDVSGQFSVLLILSVLGLLLNRGISLIRKRVLFWDPSEKEKVEA